MKGAGCERYLRVEQGRGVKGGDGVTESPRGSRVTPRGSLVTPRGSRVTPQPRLTAVHRDDGTVVLREAAQAG